MADQIDEARLIAWIDGELPPEEAARIERAVADNPGLAVLAETHRDMRARFAAVFAPLAEEPVAPPLSAEIVSLATMRAAKAGAAPARRWWVPGTIAASLVAGLLIGHIERPGGLDDRPDAVALAAPLAQALDRQLSGEPGPLRVALSFRAQDGAYCRSFTGTHLAGIACRSPAGWQLRYAAPAQAIPSGDYRMAGGDAAQTAVIATMIAGEPLDAAAERAARAAGWR
jgi:hypothetical protein